jgi:hypothetical protein
MSSHRRCRVADDVESPTMSDECCKYKLKIHITLYIQHVTQLVILIKAPKTHAKRMQRWSVPLPIHGQNMAGPSPHCTESTCPAKKAWRYLERQGGPLQLHVYLVFDNDISCLHVAVSMLCACLAGERETELQRVEAWGVNAQLRLQLCLTMFTTCLTSVTTFVTFVYHSVDDVYMFRKCLQLLFDDVYMCC